MFKVMEESYSVATQQLNPHCLYEVECFAGLQCAFTFLFVIGSVTFCPLCSSALC
jgi:hypothetical protein